MVDNQPEPPAWPDAARSLRLVRRLAAFYLGATLVVVALLASRRPALLDLRDSGLGGVAAASVLLVLAGLLATVPLAAARVRLGQAAPAPSRWNLLRRTAARDRGDPGLHLARMARWPQAIIVPPLSVAAAAVAWSFRPGAFDPSVGAILTGGSAIVCAFPLLVAERIMASTGRRALPEAPALQALLFVPVAAIPLAGLLEVGAGLGWPWTRGGMVALCAYVGLVATELTLRALANCFLPPPAPTEARAAVVSVAALLLQPGRVARDGLASPIRTHLGIDFARSWALRYIRSAALPVGAVLGLIAWGLTGVSLIPLDRRGIYERLGEPVAVWAPGAHLGLPWPLGRVRLVDFGVVHSVLLGEGRPAELAPAEAPAPATADRLWDGAHPGEVSYLIASQETDGRQAFQAVSVDLQVLYRIGLDARSARLVTYGVLAPDALVRSEAGRLLARTFAGERLEDVLGAGREAMAESLRTKLQAELDRVSGGIELVGVVIEAIHPPAGAADAYHNVQAAEIIANTAISTERGRAQATASRARQMTTELIDAAQGAAADTTGQARVAARTFTADQDAANVGGASFLLERYFANVTTALAKSQLVIVDHRLGGADAPVIDLRQFGAPPTRPGQDD